MGCKIKQLKQCLCSSVANPFLVRKVLANHKEQGFIRYYKKIGMTEHLVEHLPCKPIPAQKTTGVVRRICVQVLANPKRISKNIILGKDSRRSRVRLPPGALNKERSSSTKTR